MKKKQDYSWVIWLGAALVGLYLLRSNALPAAMCGTDATGTNTCLQKGPIVLPNTGGYSVQGGATPPTVWGDNPVDYWDMLKAVGESLG
jgi:hypothetical protein